MVSQNIYTVTNLNEQIKTVLDENFSFYNIFVKGEISNYKLHSSGHSYMTIKDENAAISAVIFRLESQKLRFELKNGMKIIARGRVSSFIKTGQVQFYISDMMPDGVGLLNMQFEKLKQKLYDEGFFDEKNKKRLPSYPSKIALITSPTGAALRDMLRILKRRWSFADIIIYPSLVQGENASKELVNALKLANKQKKADVIIIGRGGGSIEDLWAFNDENLAYEIFKSEIPVVSAVGHEPDFTISDFVADVRAPTPSAAAEISSPDIKQIISYVKELENSMEKFIENKNSIFFNNLNAFEKRLKACSPEKYIKQKYQILYMLQRSLQKTIKNNQVQCNLNYNVCVEKLEKEIDKKIEKAKNKFYENCCALDMISPLKVLKRGYSVVTNKSGQTIFNAEKLKKDEIINIKFLNGSADCKIEDVYLD